MAGVTMLVAALACGALEVQWLAPEACPAPDLSRLSASSGRAVARLEQPAAGTWRLTLTFVEPFRADRALELSSCDDARRAARALLVLGLQGAEAFQAFEAPVSPPPIVEAPAPRRVEVAARVGGAGAVGAAPGLSGRFVAGVDVRVAGFAVGLWARAGLPVDYATAVEGSRVRLWPVAGGELTGCWAPRVGRLTFGACGSLALEWWRLTGLGVTDPGQGSAAALSLGPLARLTVRAVAALELGVAAAVRVAALRPAALLDGREVLSAAPVGVEAQAFVGWRFGDAGP
ncbi:MAG: hypothetical protein INH41_30885 [Myxococcaceae bacterium]|nr:hypothetical protein [Myxococcaceae bacterium]MCA3016812.1 hypothetical protein [Myxococcaceae bacterium]